MVDNNFKFKEGTMIQTRRGKGHITWDFNESQWMVIFNEENIVPLHIVRANKSYEPVKIIGNVDEDPELLDQ